MFAGEGDATRTNRRFHLLSRGTTATRLSTAFDSVTLYGRDPAQQPDIYGKIGTAGGTGHVIEFAGDAIRTLSMEARMTVCNMSIEAGARAGLIAPDETTFEYLKGRPFAPKGAAWEQAVAYWKTLPSDADAVYDTEVELDAAEIVPQVTWGTNPEEVIPITANIPDPEQLADPVRKAKIARA